MKEWTTALNQATANKSLLISILILVILIPTIFFFYSHLVKSATITTDSDFNASTDSADLRTNGAGQDWYESRNDLQTLLTLDENNIGGNSTKKGRLASSTTANAYLTQEFNPVISTTYAIFQWDVYIEDIIDNLNYDKTGMMIVGNDDTSLPSPNQTTSERFVYLAFWKPGGGTTGTSTLIAQTADSIGNDSSTYFSVKTDINLK